MNINTESGNQIFLDQQSFQLMDGESLTSTSTHQEIARKPEEGLSQERLVSKLDSRTDASRMSPDDLLTSGSNQYEPVCQLEEDHDVKPFVFVDCGHLYDVNSHSTASISGIKSEVINQEMPVSILNTEKDISGISENSSFKLRNSLSGSEYIKENYDTCNNQDNQIFYAKMDVTPFQSYNSSRPDPTSELLKCNECGKTYYSEYHLSSHVCKVSTVNPLSCNDCGKSFFSRSHLARHLVTHSTSRVKPYSCNQCGKSFYEKSSLSTHMITHSTNRVRPYSCDECGKSFSVRSHLAGHVLTHSGVKSFKCNECGEYLSTKASLKRHSHTHSSGKTFSCKICGESFGDKSTLVLHFCTHSGLKPRTCTECGKVFSSSNFARHMRSHWGIKPFTCIKCHRTFSQKGNLARHIKITH